MFRNTVRGLFCALVALTSIAWADPGRAYLGILGEDPAAGSADTGAIVREVVPDSPAAKGGLKVGDRIVGLGDQVIANFEDLRIRMGGMKAGEKVEFKVVREDKETTVSVELEALPEAEKMPARERGDGPFRMPLPEGFNGQPFQMEQLEEMFAPQPMVGIQLQPLDENLRERLKIGDTKGVLVADVAPDGPAAKAGMRSEDVITAADDQAVESPEALKEIVKAKKKGEQIKFAVVRGEEKLDVTVEVDFRPLATRGMIPGFSASGSEGMDGRLEEFRKRVGALEEQIEGATKDGLEKLNERIHNLEEKSKNSASERIGNLEKRIADLEERLQNRTNDAIKNLEESVKDLAKKVNELASPAQP